MGGATLTAGSDRRPALATTLLFLAVLAAGTLPAVFGHRDPVPFALPSPGPPHPGAAGPPVSAPSRVAAAPAGGIVHAATLAALGDGSLLAAWYAGSAEARPDVALYTARLAPDAQAWSAPALLLDRRSAMRALGRWLFTLGNPVLAPLPDGRTALFFVVSFSGWATSRIAVMVSADGGRSWSPPRLLVTTPLFNLSTLVRNPPVAYADGSIGLPVYRESAGWPFGLLLRLDSQGHVLDSRHLGAGRAATQPALVALGPDDGLALMRDPGPHPGGVLLSRSGDAGVTWSAVGPTGLANPDSAVAALRLDRHRLLLALNPAADSRAELWLAGSADGGATWSLETRLDRSAARLDSGRREVSYPAMAIGPDGRVHVLYTYERREIRDIAIDPASLGGPPPAGAP